jgi:hypothetical protein
MTKKDYEVIAKALSQARSENPNASVRMGVDSCIEHISHALQVVEPRFDAFKFKQFIHKVCRTLER